MRINNLCLCWVRKIAEYMIEMSFNRCAMETQTLVCTCLLLTLAIDAFIVARDTKLCCTNRLGQLNRLYGRISLKTCTNFCDAQ